MNDAYILFGPEEGKKQDWLNEKKKAVLSAHPDLETVLLFTFETGPDELLDALQSASLFSSYRLVLLKNFNDVKKGPLLNALIKALKSDDDGTTLIITSEEVSQKRFPSELTALFDKDHLIPFYEMRDDEKKYYVQNLFRRENFRITPDAVTLILSLVENNTLELRTFCYPVIDFFAKRSDRTISGDDISSFLAHTREETPSTLFAYMADGNLQGAVASADRMLMMKNDGGIGTVSALGKYFRVLENLHELTLNMSLRDAFRQAGSLKTSPFDYKGVFNLNDQQSYAKALKRYSPDDTDRIITLLEEADAEVRKSPQEMLKTTLETLLYTIIVSKGRKTSLTLERELMDDSFSNIKGN
ncbi:MAG: DNA polymerase III subunit delta [Bullifex sp.]